MAGLLKVSGQDMTTLSLICEVTSSTPINSKKKKSDFFNAVQSAVMILHRLTFLVK